MRRDSVSRGLSGAARGRAGGRNGAAARPTHTVMRKRAWVSCAGVLFHRRYGCSAKRGSGRKCSSLYFPFPSSEVFFSLVVFVSFFNFLFLSEEDVIKITTGELFVLVTAMGMLPSALAEPVHTCGITLTSK